MPNPQKVLTGWTTLKEKLKTVILTPKEKETLNFLEKSKLSSFSVYSLNHDLEQLEKELEVERSNKLDVDENEILMGYWFMWGSFCSTVLDWISLKKTISSYRKVNEELQEELTRRSEIVSKRYSRFRTAIDSLKAAARPKNISMSSYPGESELSIANKLADSYQIQLSNLQFHINSLDYDKIMDF